ncbi:MAG TPA: phage tail sheath subtilisin-like domain-containing protein [Candidatus Tectomicrobia bacterium]|nr:phage tail sheath subtilisin-like domain-containing protein [Candidatus Tectomicrobia bacterium]
MPEYLAPGVYVEEVSFRSKSIEGVSTTTTGFIGPARNGPIDLEPELITSLGEFESVYGDGQALDFEDTGPLHNYLWHAVRAFFEEGGKRLYVVRVFRPRADSHSGRAAWRVPTGMDTTQVLSVEARFPGRAGNRRVSLRLSIGQDVLGSDPNGLTVNGLLDNDIVWIGRTTVGSPPGSPDAVSFAGEYYRAESYFSPELQRQTWRFRPTSGAVRELEVGSPPTNPFDPDLDEIRVVKLTVSVFPSAPDDPVGVQVWEDLALDPAHLLAGASDSVLAKFNPDPNQLSNRALARTLPIAIGMGVSLPYAGLGVLAALSTMSAGMLGAPNWTGSAGLVRSFDLELEDGNDGDRPGTGEYEGTARESDPFKTGLKALEDIEDISIVAAPGSTYLLEDGYRADAMAITGLLIAHAERMRYRIAVLDCGDNQTLAAVRAMRAKLDSKYAALYYPWVRILDPISRREIHLPPSGFVAGIYARNDINRAVYKAPANEVVNLALGFEMLLNKGQQDVLNPEGINCFRFFEGRGFRLWGARTISSDPEWKYVNLRRYFAYLERSIDKGTQWAVFEPNGEALWANVRRTIEDFLLNEWMSGALLGDKPEKAYFVRCDRSTMTQNDLDNGRLVCLIGVAALRPAEFVIFRIGQWTADRRA